MGLVYEFKSLFFFNEDEPSILTRRKLNTFIIKYDKVRCAKRLYPSVHLCLSKQSDWTRCLFKEMAN